MPTDTEAPVREGWGWLWNAKKWHYFRDGRSLCGKWGLWNRNMELELGKDESPDNCAACRRKVTAQTPDEAR